MDYLFIQMKKELEKKFKEHKFTPKLNKHMDGTYYVSLKIKGIEEQYVTFFSAIDTETLHGISRRKALNIIIEQYLFNKTKFKDHYEGIQQFLTENI